MLGHTPLPQAVKRTQPARLVFRASRVLERVLLRRHHWRPTRLIHCVHPDRPV